MNVIDELEAADLRENLIMGLESLWRGADELITATNKAGQEAFIWQTIDREDNEYLADGMLRIAKKVPAAAYAIRAMSNASAHLRTGTILLPRFIETWRFYSQMGGFKLPI